MVVFAVVLVAGALVVSFFLSDGFGFFELQSLTQHDDLVSLWEGGHYDRIIDESETILARSPMNGAALVFKGFAHFYRGVNRVSDEASRQEMHEAVLLLRKALLLPHPPLSGRIHYVLGKAYYHLGRFYYDAAAAHMETALQQGFVGGDSYKYLGLAYAELGDYEESVRSFEEAISRSPSDLLYLTAAESYAELGRYDEAESHLRQAMELSEDSYLIQRARLRLGQLYMSREAFAKAREEFERLVEENPRSADAHYNLGQAYAELDNRERARFEWREALRIDPNHQGALSSLQDN